MAHLTSRSGFRLLDERLNRFPQGTIQSDLLDRILALLFSDEEARRMAQLSLRPFSAPSSNSPRSNACWPANRCGRSIW